MLNTRAPGSRIRVPSLRVPSRQPTGQARPAAPDEARSLTAREIEVLWHCSRGSSNQEIAEKLSITVGTTKGHLHQVFRKLVVGNRTSAIAVARERGIISG